MRALPSNGSETTDSSIERLLTVDQVAEVLQVARIFVYRHAAEMGAIKVGRHLRFNSQAVEKWLSEHRLTALESQCHPPEDNDRMDSVIKRAKNRRAS